MKLSRGCTFMEFHCVMPGSHYSLFLSFLFSINASGEGLCFCHHTQLINSVLILKTKLMRSTADPMSSLMAVRFISPMESVAPIYRVCPTSAYHLTLVCLLLFLLVFLPRISFNLNIWTIHTNFNSVWVTWKICTFLWWLDNLFNINKHITVHIYV